MNVITRRESAIGIGTGATIKTGGTAGIETATKTEIDTEIGIGIEIETEIATGTVGENGVVIRVVIRVVIQIAITTGTGIGTGKEEEALTEGMTGKGAADL